MFDRKCNELNRLFCHQNRTLNNFDALTGEMPFSHFQWDNWLKSLYRMQKNRQFSSTSLFSRRLLQQFTQSKLIVSSNI